MRLRPFVIGSARESQQRCNLVAITRVLDQTLFDDLTKLRPKGLILSAVVIAIRGGELAQHVERSFG